jgi:hypothetical protein
VLPSNDLGFGFVLQLGGSTATVEGCGYGLVSCSGLWSGLDDALAEL